MEVFSNSFVKVEIDFTNFFIFAKWLPKTESMSDVEYKQTFSSIADIIEKNNIKVWLGDTLEFKTPIVPTLQDWTANELNPRLVKAGLKKMAMIVPEEFIAQISVEQSVDEMNSRNIENQFEIKYFEKIEDAKIWLLK